MIVSIDEKHETWTKQQVFTAVVLLVLLVVRFPIADFVSNLAQLIGMHPLSSWLENIRLMQNWTGALYVSWSFILVGFILVVNRRDLKSLNIDGPFIAIFITVSCLTYFKYYLWPSGWIGPIIGITLFVLYFRKEYIFAKPQPIALIILIILLIGFALRLWLIHDTLDIKKYIWPLIHRSATIIPFVLVEEVIFRGLLWKFLIDLHWSEPGVVGLQAVLFWLSHAYYMNNSVWFWITIPIASILLGIIVWRSKTITLSLFAHIFYNFV